MKRIILTLVLALVVAGGAAGYLLYSEAQNDTEEITTLKQTAVTQEELGKLKEQAVGSVTAANAAAQAAAKLPAAEQLALWRKQLASDQAAVRMTALRELAGLHGQAGPQVEELVRKVAKEDPDEDVRMMAEMQLEEWSGGGGEEKAGEEAPAEGEQP